MSVNQVQVKELDMEWVHLIMAARNLGLSRDEVRAYLKNGSHPAQHVTDPADIKQAAVTKKTIGNMGYK